MRGIYLILAIAFLSCKGEAPVENVISLDDFMGETGEQFVDTIATADTAAVLYETIISNFVVNQLTDFDTVLSSEYHPIDRFTFNTREKITFKGKETVNYGEDSEVTPTASLFYYTFSDTLKTKNAFYNWLDCFGSDCNQVKPNVELEAIKTPPGYALVYDTTIIVVNYRCEDAAFNWKPFQDSLISRFGKSYNYEIKLGCGGPLKWD